MRAVKKPVEVDVWVLGSVDMPDWVTHAWEFGTLSADVWKQNWKVRTLEGDMWAKSGDYLIKGVVDELYPCRKDVFEITYDIIEE